MSTDYCKSLVDWRNSQQQNLRRRFPSDKPLHDYTPHYHAEINNKDVLIVTFGDSWTWGTSIEPAVRTQHVYGSQLKQALDADWINIGCEGWSNSFVLEHLDFVLTLLENSAYKRIYFVVTLTENGRDLTTFPHFKYDYKKLYDQIGLGDEFYETLLQECEQFWIRQIGRALDRMDGRYHMILGQNFAWHTAVVNQFSGHSQVTCLDLNWIECLADAQQLERPIRTILVSGWIFHQISTVHDLLSTNNQEPFEYKQWALPYIEKANQVNQWLDVNAEDLDLVAKHPLKRGHAVWADYILKNLS